MNKKEMLIKEKETLLNDLVRIEKIDCYDNPNYGSYYKQAVSFDNDKTWHTSDEEYDYDFGVASNDTYAIFYKDDYIGLIVTSSCGGYNCGSYHYDLSIILDKNYRGQKIGDYAIKYIMNVLFSRPLCEDITIDILKENIISIGLFTRNGFVQINEDNETKTYVCKNSNYNK